MVSSRTIPLLLTAGLLGGCLSGLESRPDDGGPTLEERVATIEERLDRMQRQFDSGQVLDLMQRVEALHEELREVRGETESLGHDAEALNRRQRELYLDLDRRLQVVEGASRVGSVSEPVAAPDRGSEGGDAAGDDPRAAYERAFGLLQEGRYPAAIDSFKSYLQAYPDGPFADNAQYWLGEAYYVTREYETALTEFAKVRERFPDSRKLPDAMLKTGYVHYELEQWDDARQVLTEVIELVPGTTIARLAEQRLQRMRQEGR